MNSRIKVNAAFSVLNLYNHRRWAPRQTCLLFFTCSNEQAHNKTYNNTYVTSNESDQPVHPQSMARVLVHPSLDSPEAVEGTCDDR